MCEHIVYICTYKAVLNESKNSDFYSDVRCLCLQQGHHG